MALFVVNAAKQALSAHRAADKADALRGVLNDKYRTSWAPYDGTSDILDVKTALTYVVSKKSTKAERKDLQASATYAFGAAGKAVGGTLGSVALPVVGTAVGAITGGMIIGSVPTVATRSFRVAKYIYKRLHGTQGVHRKQAATVLYTACKSGDPASVNTHAAAAGLLIILGGGQELQITMGLKAEEAIDYIADRLKSW